MEYEKKQRIYKIIMLVVICVTVSIIGTTMVLYKYWGENEGIKYFITPSVDNELTTKNSRLRAAIDKFYLGQVDDQKLEDAALQGYIKGLEDEYSEYIPKKEMEAFSANTLGNYNGIGIYYGRLADTNEVVIIAPIKNTPAYNAGILPGDIILKIDNEEIKEEDSLTELSNKIKGEIGTKIKLEIRRDKEIKEFEITRENIKLHYIDTDVLNDNIGYMWISSFDEGTAKEFEEKYSELENKGIKSLIIDLRNNGGGIVDEATDIADYILKKDSTILITKDKNGTEKLTIANKEHTIDIPIIILVNENSASATEILAGALKDNNVAKIVGEKTYGKGVIQNIFTLNNGAGLKLTTNEYFTPNNNKINHIGIEPDVKVSLPEELEEKFEISNEEDTQLQKAIELLK